MNEQTRIPLPRDKSKPEASGNSLIERAVANFDLTSFAPPPVPEALLGQKPRPKVVVPSVLAAPSPAVVEPEPQPELTPELETEPAPEPEPEPEPAFASAPLSATEPQVDAPPETPRTPAVFGRRRISIDRKALADAGMIEPEGKVTTLLEEFRIVKRRLLAQAAELGRRGQGVVAQRILVSSPHQGEGKTYCAVNLALSIAAEKENEVLLVDADFAKPSVLEVLGLPEAPGLMDALSNESIDVADLVMATDIPGLAVLPAGMSTNSDSEFVSSSRTPRILEQLTEGAAHRIVIFDSSPALAVSTAAELAKHVGQVVMVVRADSTGQGALEDAISLLSACPNVQLLLNGAQFSPSGRRFGDYGYRG